MLSLKTIAVHSLHLKSNSTQKMTPYLKSQGHLKLKKCWKGFFNENELRNKEKSIRLETNLV